MNKKRLKINQQIFNDEMRWIIDHLSEILSNKKGIKDYQKYIKKVIKSSK